MAENGQIQAGDAEEATAVAMPKPLDVQGNLARNWQKFRQVWNSYEILTNLQSPELIEYCVKTFITCVGHDALRIYHSLQFEEEAHKRDIDKTIEKNRAILPRRHKRHIRTISSTKDPISSARRLTSTSLTLENS